MRTNDVSGVSRYRRLEKLINTAVLVSVAALLAAVATNLYFGHARATPKLKPILHGQSVHLPYDTHADGRPTLVLVLSTHCAFCQDGMPFFRILSAFHESAPGVFHLLAVFPQAQSEANAYLRSNALVVDRVLSLPVSRIGVNGTPTLLLLDRASKIDRSWEGLPGTAEQAQILGSLKDLCNGCGPPLAGLAGNGITSALLLQPGARR